jgi:hypothetical protein
LILSYIYIAVLKNKEMQNNSGYSCKFCNREYKIKFNHDRHIQTCEFLSKSKKEQDHEIDSFEKLPTQREMFLLIQDLSIRINKLEKENAMLKNSVKCREKRNFADILLQTAGPSISMDDWSQNILNSVDQFLDIVYKKDLFTATISLFNKFIDDNLNEIPIRAYDVKPNTFYTYDTEKWIPFTNSDFDKLLARVSHRFLVEFNRCWCIVNKEKIENSEEYQKLYTEYYLKILGGDRVTDETRYKKIRHVIYTSIKKNIKSSCIEE